MRVQISANSGSDKFNDLCFDAKLDRIIIDLKDVMRDLENIALDIMVRFIPTQPDEKAGRRPAFEKGKLVFVKNRPQFFAAKDFAV